MDIYLKKSILHIIDRETGSPVFSQKELDLTKEYIRDFLQKKIQKISSAQTKTGQLAEESMIVESLKIAQENFVEASEAIVQRWFDIYQESEEAPSADVFVVLYGRKGTKNALRKDEFLERRFIMAVDIQKLKGRIVEKSKNVNEVAKEIGIDKSTLYRKIKSNGANLTIKEVTAIAKCLQLSYDDIKAIFFKDL